MRRTQGGIQYVEHSEGDGAEVFAAICKLGLEGIVSKKINTPYRSAPFQVLAQDQKPEGGGSDTNYRRRCVVMEPKASVSN
jgi:ATP-dependent DNA ligase